MANEIPKIYDILRNKYMKDGLSSLRACSVSF